MFLRCLGEKGDCYGVCLEKCLVFHIILQRYASSGLPHIFFYKLRKNLAVKGQLSKASRTARKETFIDHYKMNSTFVDFPKPGTK